jgi:hypothetical protein
VNSSSATFTYNETTGAVNNTLSSKARAGISLLAVPNLKAVLELDLDNLQDFEDSGKINISETAQYDMGPLSVGLWAVEWISQADGADVALYVNPWVSYTLGSIVPRLDVGYGIAAQADFLNSSDNGAKWHRTNYSPTYDDDSSIISIRPSVKFNLDKNSWVEIGDLIDIDGKKDGWGDKDSRISNVFYANFKWAF